MTRSLHKTLLALGFTGYAAIGGTPVRADAPAAARLRVGAGMAQRAIEAPSSEGPRDLEFGPAPALMLGIDGYMRASAWTLGLGLTYRTSLLGRVADSDAGPGASASKTPVRSHNFEAGLRAGLHLGASQNIVIGLFGGYDVRALTSVAELRVPRFNLHGPVLRLEIVLPLQAAHMRVRLAPELQWIAAVSGALQSSSGLTQPAFALGGVAQLQLPIDERFELQLDYRESHAFAQSRNAPGFSDVERYLLLVAALRMP